MVAPAITGLPAGSTLVGIGVCPTTGAVNGLDSARDALVTQVPPNNGTLNTIGMLGLDTTGVDGFDIGSDGRAFAALRDGSGSRLSQIDLASGAPSQLADLGLALYCQWLGVDACGPIGLATAAGLRITVQ